MTLMRKLLLSVLLLGTFFNPSQSFADEEEKPYSDEVAMEAPGSLEKTILKEPKIKQMKVSKSGKAEKLARIALEKSRKPAKAKIKKHQRKRKS